MAAVGKRAKLCRARSLRIADLDAWCSMDAMNKGTLNGRLFLSDTSISQLRRMAGTR